jgi:hypothetical protein
MMNREEYVPSMLWFSASQGNSDGKSVSRPVILRLKLPALAQWRETIHTCRNFFPFPRLGNPLPGSKLSAVSHQNGAARKSCPRHSRLRTTFYFLLEQPLPANLTQSLSSTTCELFTTTPFIPDTPTCEPVSVRLHPSHSTIQPCLFSRPRYQAPLLRLSIQPANSARACQPHFCPTKLHLPS